MFGWTTITVIFSGVWTLIKPIVVMLVNDVKKDAVAKAIEIVSALATADMSSGEKREAAFDEIKNELREGAEEIKDSTVNLLVELAVAKLKEDEKQS